MTKLKIGTAEHGEGGAAPPVVPLAAGISGEVHGSGGTSGVQQVVHEKSTSPRRIPRIAEASGGADEPGSDNAINVYVDERLGVSRGRHGDEKNRD